jgi:hypothetical protein
MAATLEAVMKFKLLKVYAHRDRKDKRTVLRLSFDKGRNIVVYFDKELDSKEVARKLRYLSALAEELDDPFN